jgi:hypothetical protein
MYIYKCIEVVHKFNLEFRSDYILKNGIISQKGIELLRVLTEGYQTSKRFELKYQTIKTYNGRVFHQDLLLNPDGARNTCLSCDFLRAKYPFH